MLYIDLFLFAVLFSVTLESTADEQTKNTLRKLRYSILVLMSAAFLRLNIQSYGGSDYIQIIFTISPFLIVAGLASTVWFLIRYRFLLVRSVLVAIKKERVKLGFVTLGGTLLIASILNSFWLYLIVLIAIVILLIADGVNKKTHGSTASK